MAINIKELFVTDLDPNSGAWWSKDKVDKINYNFYLLSNGGMPGPQGTIGVDGGFGPIGAQGTTGYEGPQGYQGYQGAGSLNDWVYFPEDSGLPGYLYPRKNPINIAQSAPVGLRIGYLNTNGEVGAGPQEPIQVVKVVSNDWDNLRVEDTNDSNGYNFSFKSSGGEPRFEISPSITGTFTKTYTAQTIIFKTYVPGTNPYIFKDSITITDSQIIVNTSGLPGPGIGPTFNLSNATGKFTRSEDEFRYTPGANVNKVLVSTNNQGDVEWKDIKDVFGTFPIGSIISIRESEFISDHFWLDDSINVTSGSPLNNIYGRGKLGTDYEGWYLCNGETWETEQGFNQYLTPNLNNFSYTIDANGDAQNLITVPESDPVVIGGYDLRISAVPDVNGIYSVGYTNPFYDNNTSPGTSSLLMGTSGIYYTSRMIHIVYLEDPNLKWSNTGVYVPPVTTTLITLTLPLTTPLAIANQCTAPVTTNYSWTGTTPANWNIFTVPSTTYKLFNYGTTTYAPTGWYVNVDGYPIYWDGSNFTSRGTTCTPPTNNYTFNFLYNELVDLLNGTINSTTPADLYLDYNAPLFINATTLTWSDDQLTYPVGSNAPAGWYRDVVTGVRRYWSGSAFQGVSFTQDYVHFVYGPSINNWPEYNWANLNTNPSSGYYENSQCAVNWDRETHLTYVAGNAPAILINAPSGNSMTVSVANYDSPLYVPLGWVTPLVDIDGTVLATPPLINIKDQFKQGSTTQKYRWAYMDIYSGVNGQPGEYYGALNTTGVGATGKIAATYTC